MNKVNENEESDIYECQRCNGNYCNECNTPEEIDFDVCDLSEEESREVYIKKVEINPRNWKGTYVCPFCYNQLLDKHFEK